MARSLLIFLEGIHKIKCKHGDEDKKCETCWIKYKYCDCFLENINFKDDLIERKRFSCNKNYQHKLDEKLKEQFFNTCKYFNYANNKFFMLLQKGIYPYDYMDDWEKVSETLLPEKEDFYSHLSMEDITVADYVHEKRVCKDFEKKS